MNVHSLEIREVRPAGSQTGDKGKGLQRQARAPPQKLSSDGGLFLRNNGKPLSGSRLGIKGVIRFLGFWFGAGLDRE